MGDNFPVPEIHPPGGSVLFANGPGSGPGTGRSPHWNGPITMLAVSQPTTDRSRNATRRFLSVERESSIRKRLIARDERALVELIDLATPWLLGVTQSMLSDPAEAEEVVMESFHVAWNRIEISPDAEGGLMPWLLRVTRNRAIDQRRHVVKTRRAEIYSDIGDAITPPEEPNEAGQPGWHVHEKVQAAMKELPPEQQKAVYLAFYRGLTHSEIAEELQIPLGTVKTRLRLAFGRLRGTLATLKEWIV